MVDLFELLIGKEGDKDYKKKPVIVQGITGKFGAFHTQQMLAYGTNIVAGVTPGKGGQKQEGVPIYETMNEAVSA
ncbi:MAG TPA: succinate--CoA ligase subunit alpha, partial [Candidatus Nitrosotalea sp.]|nr:succinate--CoA ligase subunit alpha [Candidatus Nitrosotalea sp.]